MDSAEKNLIELSAKGNVEAFETLVQAHQKRVYNIALRMTKDPDDAQELSQDALVRAFVAIKKFRGESSFSTWLYRITMNVCTDFLRKRNKAVVVSLEQGAAGKFLEEYYNKKIYEFDPFARLDRVGVGSLVKIAVEKGQKTRPDIKLGICGEHGGDPSSIQFCHEVGLNYVSCSPYRVPLARLAAAQAAIMSKK